MVEGVDAGQHPLDIAFGKLRARPRRPLVVERVRRILGTVTKDQPIVGKASDAAVAKGVMLDVGSVGQRLIPAHGGVGQRGEAIHRRGDLPFILIIGSPTSEIPGVLEGDQLAEGVGVRDDLDLPRVQRTGNSQDVH